MEWTGNGMLAASFDLTGLFVRTKVVFCVAARKLTVPVCRYACSFFAGGHARQFF